LGIAIHPDGDRNPSSPTPWQYRLNFLRYDLFNVDLGVCGTRSKQGSDHSYNDEGCSNHGRDS
jgi:hypothetical protein